VLIFGLIGAIAMATAAAAAFLPWARDSGMMVDGLSRDGKLTLPLALLGLICSLLAIAFESRWLFIGVLAPGITLTVITLIDILDITGTAGLALSNVGVGLVLGAAAGALSVVAGAGGSSLVFSTPRK
jgi:hypothetical protein